MSVEVTGIADVVSILSELTPREAKNLMRATTADIAKTLAADARDAAPSDEGDLKGGIRHKRARGTRDRVEAEVVANTNGTSFYWRFREYGQGPDGREDAMFLKSLHKLDGNLQQAFLDAFAEKLTAMMARKARR